MLKSLHETRRHRRSPARRNRSAVAAAMIAALLTSACAQGGLELPDLSLAPSNLASPTQLTTGSIASSPLDPVGTNDALAPVRTKTAASAIAQAHKLRAQGQKAKALTVLEAASQTEPDNKALLRERGLVAADLGRIGEAKDLLRSSLDPAHPDWRTHSALGSALAADGKHADAQNEFARALELAPDHPSVLNNLALSYALDGKHDRAEALLRQAADRSGNVKTKQNLALLLGLKGRTDESRQVASTVLPRETAIANASYLSDLHESNVKVSRATRKVPASIRSARAASN